MVDPTDEPNYVFEEHYTTQEQPKEREPYICDEWCGHPADSEKCWCDKYKFKR